MNCYTGDTLKIDITKQWNISEFDAVIGNPPYSTNPSEPNTKPLYDKFIEKYIDKTKMLLFVVPSRWFIGGKGLDNFREFMLKRKDIVMIKHEDDAKKWFGNNVSIEGGIHYFLKDALHNGFCQFNKVSYDLSKYDCVIKPQYHPIVDTVQQMESISKLYKGRYFGIETNDKRFKEIGKVKCFVSLQKSKDRCKYIDNFEFNDKNTFWKVITARANGKSPKFGEMFIGKPYEIHTGSYISFCVNNEEEAKSLLSYLKTKFANNLLSIRKISQDISENTCKWIPLVPLDRNWTDEKVCEYLKIEQALYI
jgi:site-specific DNA-methyltransferase (adenine-specific)